MRFNPKKRYKRREDPNLNTKKTEKKTLKKLELNSSSINVNINQSTTYRKFFNRLRHY